MIGTIIGAVASLGSAIYGGIKSSQENEKARRLIAKQRAENKRWYETKKGQDYTMRSDVQAAINKQRELLDEQYKRARATNTVAGGTDASLALQRESANQATADMMSNVAANSANYKDNIEQQYRAQDAALNQQQAQGHQQQAAQNAQAASQAVNAGIKMVGEGLAAQGLKTDTGADVASSFDPNWKPSEIPDVVESFNQQVGVRKQNR